MKIYIELVEKGFSCAEALDFAVTCITTPTTDLSKQAFELFVELFRKSYGFEKANEVLRLLDPYSERFEYLSGLLKKYGRLREGAE